MIVRTYTRRSKNDEGKQQFSLDVQTKGCEDFIARMGFSGHPLVDYVDDGRSGDDFLGRTGLRRLLADAQRGDAIICRDQSRLGRDAIEVTLVVRDLVRDRGCRLFYYTTGQEVQFANAIDQATTFIAGTGHQMELEAIRSRVREALRARVREGRIAGGACFGYTLERRTDPTGRKYTVALVNETEAQIVRRIFEMYLNDMGLKAIAHQLNAEGVRAPAAGRRGSGSWAPTAIRAMLLNPRYRGVYMHGRVKKVRQNGTTLRVKAEAHETITIDIPEWRIVDDQVWFGVQERFDSRGPRAPIGRPPARHALTGIAKCAHCGGSVLAAAARAHGGGAERVKTYACTRHHQRGSTVCPVTVYQSTNEVESVLVDYIAHHILTERVLDEVLAEIQSQIAEQLPKRDADVAALETELRDLRVEQKRLARAVALADDVPELVTELRQRSARIHHLEGQVVAAKKTPDEMTKLVKRIETSARAKLADMRAALADETDRREVFLALFPDGLTFAPDRTPNGKRQVWRVTGEVDLGSLIDATGSKRITTRTAANDANQAGGTSANPLEEGAGSNRVVTPKGRYRLWTENSSWICWLRRPVAPNGEISRVLARPTSEVWGGQQIALDFRVTIFLAVGSPGWGHSSLSMLDVLVDDHGWRWSESPGYDRGPRLRLRMLSARAVSAREREKVRFARWLVERAADGGVEVWLVLRARDNDRRNRDPVWIAPLLFAELRAVHFGHLNVQEDQLGALRLYALQCFTSACGGVHRIAGVREDRRDQVSGVFFIVNDEDVHHRDATRKNGLVAMIDAGAARLSHAQR